MNVVSLSVKSSQIVTKVIIKINIDAFRRISGAKYLLKTRGALTS